MNNLFIAATKRTPEISFNTNGQLSISGISIPENVNDFYKSAFDWLDDFYHDHPNRLSLTIQFEYLNTSSTSCILKILRKIKSIAGQTTKLFIVWKYESDDDDMLEQGNILQHLVDHKFTFELRS